MIRNKYFIYSSFALITFATLALTLVPAENLGHSNLFQYDKAGHFLLFFFWTLSFGLLIMVKIPTATNIFWIMIAGSVFGTVIEVIQYAMPYGRNLDFFDVLADILGSITAGFTLYYIKTRYKEIINP
ncbi:MAG: VanZ family protein [Balneolaceae bacterium]